MEKIITCTAPVNIAVIKYWGKRDETLVLPLNDSVSFTLSSDEMCATTTVMLSPKFTCDRLWLNDKEENINKPRIQNCLKELRRRASKRKRDAEDPSHLGWHAHICSRNNFPTAAGLASSAAGYACLVFALGKVLEIEDDLSSVARLGSGSACRSLLGGLVRWRKGKALDGSDSVAEQVASQHRWSDLHVIICVANSDRKKTSSTEGMQRSVETSSFMKYRIEESVGRRLEALLEAVKENNWNELCDLTIKDSNELHSVCLDTFPPCVYMNDTSHAVAQLIHAYNHLKEEQEKWNEKVCYTFDAGPNACLFVPVGSVDEVTSLLSKCFPASKSANDPDARYWQGKPVNVEVALQDDLVSVARRCEQPNHSMKFFIHTSIGSGPKVLPDEDDTHLIDTTTGLPKFTSTTQENGTSSQKS